MIYVSRAIKRCNNHFCSIYQNHKISTWASQSHHKSAEILYIECDFIFVLLFLTCKKSRENFVRLLKKICLFQMKQMTGRISACSQRVLCSDLISIMKISTNCMNGKKKWTDKHLLLWETKTHSTMFDQENGSTHYTFEVLLHYSTNICCRHWELLC